MSQTYAGEIRGGVVVFDAGTPPLADGTRVQVEAAMSPGDLTNGTHVRTEATVPTGELEAMRDLLLSIAGQARGPLRQAETHDRVEPSAPEQPEPKSLAERYAAFIGIIDGLPSDMAEEHDHYIHGTPRRNPR